MIQIRPVTHLPPDIQSTFERLGDTHMKHMPPGWFMAYAEIEERSVFLVGQHPKLNESIHHLECDPHVETIAPTTDLTPDLIDQAAARGMEMIQGAVVAESVLRETITAVGIPLAAPHELEVYHRPEGITLRWLGGNTRLPAKGFFLGSPALESPVQLGGTGFEILVARRPPDSMAFSGRVVLDLARNPVTLGPYSPPFPAIMSGNASEIASQASQAIAQAFSYIHSDMVRVAEESLLMFEMAKEWGMLGRVINTSIENLRRDARQKN